MQYSFVCVQVNDEELFKFLKSLGLFEEEKTLRSNKTATVNIFNELLLYITIYIRCKYGRFSKIVKMELSFRGLNS